MDQFQIPSANCIWSRSKTLVLESSRPARLNHFDVMDRPSNHKVISNPVRASTAFATSLSLSSGTTWTLPCYSNFTARISHLKPSRQPCSIKTSRVSTLHASATGTDNDDRFDGSSRFDLDPWAGPKLLKDMPDKLGENVVSILWFRNDLRLMDNPALTLASTAGVMAPIYIFDLTKYGRRNKSPWGFARIGPFRADFIKESVIALRRKLRFRRSDVYFRQGNPVEQIVSLARDLSTKLQKPIALVAHKETTWEETQDEKAVQRQLEQLSKELGIPIDVHFVWTATMHHPEDLPFNPAGPALPPTFTAYRKCIKYGDGIPVREELPIPEELPRFPVPLRLRNDPEPSLRVDLEIEGLANPHDHPFPDPRGVHPFEGGEEEGNERITEYIWMWKGLEEYKSTRNSSGQRNTSTKLSPWMSLGCISPRTLYWNAKRFEDENEGQTEQTSWLKFELMARDYFRWVSASAGSRLFALNGFSRKNDRNPINEEAPLFERHLAVSARDKRNLELWIEGKTGAPFVDANMRELKATGFISNRGRQNVASFLIHDLNFPDWRAGAEYFEQQLIDYDVASNWGNWAYLAGVGSDPRVGRKLNVIKQSMDFEPSGWYIRRWCPELLELPSPMIHQPHLLPEVELSTYDMEPGDYPIPVTDLPTAPQTLIDSLAKQYPYSRNLEWAAQVRQDFIDAGAEEMLRPNEL